MPYHAEIKTYLILFTHLLLVIFVSNLPSQCQKRKDASNGSVSSEWFLDDQNEEKIGSGYNLIDS